MHATSRRNNKSWQPVARRMCLLLVTCRQLNIPAPQRHKCLCLQMCYPSHISCNSLLMILLETPLISCLPLMAMLFLMDQPLQPLCWSTLP